MHSRRQKQSVHIFFPLETTLIWNPAIAGYTPHILLVLVMNGSGAEWD